MKAIILAAVLCLLPSVVCFGQAPSTAQAIAKSRAGAARWSFWLAKPNVRQGLARETTRTRARSNATARTRRRR